MTTLREFRQNKFQIEFEDQIFIQRFEGLFSNLHNGENIIALQIGFSADAKKEITNALRHLKTKSGKKLLLFTNGDLDIPCPRPEFYLQDNMPYTEEFQRQLENTPYEQLVDMSLLEEFRDDINVFCHAVTRTAPGLHMIPLGRDWKGVKNLVEQSRMPSENRNILCYYNCSMPPVSVHWYGRIRAHIANACLQKSFVLCKNLRENRVRTLDFNTFDQYHLELSHSEFMICPRGCGADTYRMWDCLYLGCIPIVVKYDGYKEMDDLPILFVDSWEDFLSLDEKFLKDASDSMLDKEFNYDKLKFSWWEQRIRKEM